MARRREEREELDERVVHITRVAKAAKGGRRFGFRVVAVVGDNNGRVGMGIGRARGVPDAIGKAMGRARDDMQRVPMVDNTIPHEIMAEHGASKVLLKPASPGTGIRAGGGVRAVVEAAGIKDILSKSLGSNNVLNVVRATVEGLRRLRSVEEVARSRGKSACEVMPFWGRGHAQAE
ncbi:MAG: 30S ribosomal protein S5 [Chloroflexota bacterium]|nr:30S ribosomal protein S5 [Chloroflexota bacterium]